MAPLDKALFTEGPHVDGSELAKGEVVNNSASVDNVLKNFNWNGKAIGVIVLNLSADNRQIESAEFVSRGELEDKEIRMDCSKLWQMQTLTRQAPSSSCDATISNSEMV